jgi:hypothetical protein
MSAHPRSLGVGSAERTVRTVHVAREDGIPRSRRVSMAIVRGDSLGIGGRGRVAKLRPVPFDPGEGERA